MKNKGSKKKRWKIKAQKRRWKIKAQKKKMENKGSKKKMENKGSKKKMENKGIKKKMENGDTKKKENKGAHTQEILTEIITSSSSLSSSRTASIVFLDKESWKSFADFFFKFFFFTPIDATLKDEVGSLLSELLPLK